MPLTVGQIRATLSADTTQYTRAMDQAELKARQVREVLNNLIQVSGMASSALGSIVGGKAQRDLEAFAKQLDALHKALQNASGMMGAFGVAVAVIKLGPVQAGLRTLVGLLREPGRGRG